MTALVPCSWWKRRSLVVLAPPTEQGLPGDMAVGPSELSSGRGGRSTDRRKGKRGQIFSFLIVHNGEFYPAFLPCLTHVIHDGGLCSLAIEVDHSVDTGRNVPGCRTLRHTIYKEVEAAILLPHDTNSVTCLQEKKKI